MCYHLKGISYYSETHKFVWNHDAFVIHVLTYAYLNELYCNRAILYLKSDLV